MVNEIFAEYLSLTQEQCLVRWKPGIFPHKSNAANLSPEAAESLNENSFNGSKDYYQNLLLINKKFYDKDHFNDTFVNAHLRKHAHKLQLIDDSIIFAADKQDIPIYLVRPYHTDHANYYDIVKDEYSRHIQTHRNLHMLYPLSIFKQSWSRGKNLTALLSPHKLRYFDSLHDNNISELMQKALKIPNSSINDEDSIIIDSRIIYIAELHKWKGFTSCSQLESLGVLQSSRGRNCVCFNSLGYARNKTTIKTPSGQSFKIPRTTCFSRNVIYVCECTHCGLLYVGKCAQGITNRQWKKRNNEHIRSIVNTYDILRLSHFYSTYSRGQYRLRILYRLRSYISRLQSILYAIKQDKKDKQNNINEDDTTNANLAAADRDEYKEMTVKERLNAIIDDKLHLNDENMDDIMIREILVSTQLKLTGDVKHILGLDGSICYKSITGDDPISIYRSFIIDQLDTEPDSAIIEAIIKEREQKWQARLCTIYMGLNGTGDWNNVRTFTADAARFAKTNDLHASITEDERLNYQQKINDIIRRSQTYTWRNLHFPDYITASMFPTTDDLCPDGHRMAEFDLQSLQELRADMKFDDNYDQGAICDICDKTITTPVSVLYCCTSCEYDLCANCFSGKIRGPYSISLELFDGRSQHFPILEEANDLIEALSQNNSDEDTIDLLEALAQNNSDEDGSINMNVSMAIPAIDTANLVHHVDATVTAADAIDNYFAGLRDGLTVNNQDSIISDNDNTSDNTLTLSDVQRNLNAFFDALK